MNEIRLLDKGTIDKIAAGEVIERPLSVVKELVENSIDSGADAITVELTEGGKELIRVTDNGSGIDPKYISTAFLRHATSKITNERDLYSLRSLGFRGEALSSVAAVSKVSLITKRADEITGIKYDIEGGVEMESGEIGAPNGTSIFVRDLFYNTPVRLKFLKSANTEGSHTRELVEHLALSREDISFKFIMGGKERFATTGTNDLKNTIFEIYGKTIAEALLPIDYSKDGISIKGYIGKSIIARSNRAFELFFINNRFIKSSVLSNALEEGFSGYMMGGKFPFAVLKLTFPDNSVDVNVHPSKMEVRFDEPLAVAAILKEAVESRLSFREDIEEIKLTREEKSRENITVPEPFEIKRLSEIRKNVREKIKEDTPYEIKYEKRPEGQNERIIAYEQQTFLSRQSSIRHRVIGQVFDTYWLIEYDGKLYILDQHAAHEKILYERTMKELNKREMMSQQISPPIIVTISATEDDRLNQYSDALRKIGFDYESFGGNEISITAVPGNFFNVDARGLFLDILSTDAPKTSEMITERVASISCKAAVKGNHEMSFSEVKGLMEELMTLDNPYHCPHGRPTLISFTRSELDKKFKRIL